MGTFTFSSMNATVGEVGYGLMGLTKPPNPPSEEQTFNAMKTALAQGCNFWNGGEFYGTPDHNSLTLLNKYFTKYPEDADKVVLSIKGCLKNLVPDCSPSGIRASLENCLSMLPPSVKTIDFFEPARGDPNFPVEETVATLAELIREGKIRGYMLSEVRGETIRRAHKVHPVSGVELELSLWGTEILRKENGAAEACAELGVPVIAYAPIGQGMLSGEIRSFDDIPEYDVKRRLPRFQSDVFPINLRLVDELGKLAVKKGVTPAQLARQHHFDSTSKLQVIPIPGSVSASRIYENAAAKDVEWTGEDEIEVSRIMGAFEVRGERYPEAVRKLWAQ